MPTTIKYLDNNGLSYFWDKIDAKKQNKLTAGSNITIAADNTISATQPTVGNATLTIQKNGTSAGTFTANASQNKTINITVPEIKKRTGATTTTNITPLYVAGDGTNTPMALKTHGDDHTGSFAYVNINEPTGDISEAYIGGYVWDEYEDWWRKMSEKKLALYSDIPTVNNATLTIQKNGSTVKTFTANASSNVTANITVPTTVAELSDSSDYATTTDLATKQNLLSPGNHISIASNVISATGYVHSENPQASAAASSTITGSMIANGTITADKLASDATVKLTMSTSDIGEGAPLAANTLYGVYR